ncbi:M56 family metallopeptidase [Pseudoclavibacter chungangensis]|uniref:M56 family metallopeptidase n=2 Tax=Pseudoclavibacter chungangensis TaxID=587635 RepID=A0A7J5BPG7_9MICO|nr:M56 family metallopeptidase [Pseudoclavibacter chungangensis]KAB1652163.1 M56 family metallopeptidase [Pseudoclavibacter chungangensis]
MLLARAGWPSRAPGTALVLWQAIALAGGLSMIGAPLCLGLAPYGDSLPSAVLGAVRSSLPGGQVALPIISFGALLAAATIAGYLLANLATTMVRVRAQRKRHDELLALLSSPHPTREKTRVLDDATPLAYCLPRGFGSLTVLSKGLIDSLSREELTAVVAHEEAHLQQRHDIVLIAFRAWHAALPGFPIAALAESSVTALVEMLADDRARAVTDDSTVARAALTVAERAHITGQAEHGDRATAPAEVDEGFDERTTVLRARLTRLADPRPPLGLGARALVIAAAVSLVAVPTLVLTLPL